MALNLITDRSEDDILELQNIYNKIANNSASAEEIAQWNNGMRGAFGPADILRMANNFTELKTLADARGLWTPAVYPYSLTDYASAVMPTTTGNGTYLLGNINYIRNHVGSSASVPEALADYEDFNQFESAFLDIKERIETAQEDYITVFCEDDDFNFGVMYSTGSDFTASKCWDGTIEYSYDADTWVEWDITTLTYIPVVGTGTERRNLYLRGTNNTYLTWVWNSYWHLFAKPATRGHILGVNGNIEYLLDYQITKAGGHPTIVCNYPTYYRAMGLLSMFNDWDELSTYPDVGSIYIPSYSLRNLFGMTARYRFTSDTPKFGATTVEYGGFIDLMKYAGIDTLPVFNHLTLVSPASGASTNISATFETAFAYTNVWVSQTYDAVNYPYEWKVSEGDGTTPRLIGTDCFRSTKGTYKDSLYSNTTYYTKYNPNA